jgi:prevent-host-death family protein
MTISVTEFKTKCLQVLKEVRAGCGPIEITRHGKVVARIVPAEPAAASAKQPWERLRGRGRLLAKAEEGVLSGSDFEAAQ